MIPTLYDVALGIGRFPPIYPYLHIHVSSCLHTLLFQSYINVSNKSSLTTKISYIYHFPRETPTFTILYQSTLSIYRNTSVLLKIKRPIPREPLSPPDATTCHAAISSANLEPLLGYPNHWSEPVPHIINKLQDNNASRPVPRPIHNLRQEHHPKYIYKSDRYIYIVYVLKWVDVELLIYLW